MPGIGRWSWREVRSVRCLDQDPAEGFECDVLAIAECAEQIRHPPARQAGGYIVEESGGRLTQLPGDEVVHGEVDHDVSLIAVSADRLADGNGQESVTKQRDGTLAQSCCHLTPPVPRERDSVAVDQAPEKIDGDCATGQFKDLFGPRFSAGRGLWRVGRHAFSIAATATREQAPIEPESGNDDSITIH